MNRKAWIVALACALTFFLGCQKETGEKRPSLSKPSDLNSKDYRTAPKPLDEAGDQCNREIMAVVKQASGKKTKPSPCAIDALLKAVEQDDREKIKLLINSYDGLLNAKKGEQSYTALASAYYADNIPLLQFLLDHGADVNEDYLPKRESGGSLSLLEEAVCDRKMDVVKLLIQKGADLNISDGEGSGPFTCIIHSRDLEMAKLLLDHGANPNMLYWMPFEDLPEDEPWQWGAILNLAIIYGNPEMVELLLNHSADPNIKNDFGRTPLFVAIHKGDKQSVTLLLAHAGKVNIKDKRGTTPLHFAVLAGQKEIAELLRQHGGVE